MLRASKTDPDPRFLSGMLSGCSMVAEGTPLTQISDIFAPLQTVGDLSQPCFAGETEQEGAKDWTVWLERGSGWLLSRMVAQIPGPALSCRTQGTGFSGRQRTGD